MTTGAASPADAMGSAFTILLRVGTIDICHLPAVPIAGKRCRRQQHRFRVIGLRVKTRKPRVKCGKGRMSIPTVVFQLLLWSRKGPPPAVSPRFTVLHLPCQPRREY